MKASVLLILTAAATFAAAPTYKVITKIKIGGGNRWDYSYVDSNNHRLYVSHGTQTEVIDTTPTSWSARFRAPTACTESRSRTIWGSGSPATAATMTSPFSISRRWRSRPRSRPARIPTRSFTSRRPIACSPSTAAAAIRRLSTPRRWRWSPPPSRWAASRSSRRSTARGTSTSTSRTRMKSSRWTRRTRWLQSAIRSRPATVPAGWPSIPRK